MGVFARGRKLWIRFRDVDGKWRNIRSGFDVGQEQLAQAREEALLARVAAELAGDKARSPIGDVDLTVRAYAATWIAERRTLDLDWKNDEGRLKHHVLPAIGDMPVASVRTRHIVDLFKRIRTTPSETTGEVVSQRTVYNIYSVVSAMFRDAKLADKIEQSPCCLDERQLGPLRDKDPEWRVGAVFAREEVETLISDERIPPDRQLVYALELLAGVRPGEAAALRWRHYDPSVEPLGKMLVALAYNTRKNRAKGTKTEVVKHVPVHATLAAMLAEWKLSGWEAMMGRAPEPDDLIVPLPPAAAARRRTREGEPFRGHDYSGKRWRDEDLPALGWRHRRHYDMRATFITLALDDGADPDVIETRVTHTKKSRGAFDGYNRGLQWAKTCGEVAKLRIVRKVHRRAIAVGDVVTELVTSSASADDDEGKEWRRRESKARGPSLYVVPCMESSTVDAGDPTPSDAERRDAVTSPVTSVETIADPVAAQLEAAAMCWRDERDERALRRRLIELLAEIG